VLLIKCPFCGERPEIEFSYGGQAQRSRPADPSLLSDQDWADYLYMRRNRRGVHTERWRHIYGCERYFNARRDTSTDQILATYRIGETAP
jgi:sarcosine oxidase subunit delta